LILRENLKIALSSTAIANSGLSPIWLIASAPTKGSLNVQTQTIKEKITKVVMSQPDDATYDEIMRELAFSRMVDRGLEDMRSGRVISNSEMANRIRSWQK
jgi:predicted transcriptional regulator